MQTYILPCVTLILLKDAKTILITDWLMECEETLLEVLAMIFEHD